MFDMGETNGSTEFKVNQIDYTWACNDMDFYTEIMNFRGEISIIRFLGDDHLDRPTWD